MLPSSDDSSTPDRSRQLRHWGPIAIAAVIVLVVVVVVVVANSGNDNNDKTTTNTTAVSNPTGAISWTEA